MYLLPFEFKIPGWLLGMVAASALAQASIARSSDILSRNARRVFTVLNVGGFGVLLLFLITTLWFPIVEIQSAFCLLLIVTTLEVYRLRKVNDPESRFILGGILLAVAAVAVVAIFAVAFYAFSTETVVGTPIAGEKPGPATTTTTTKHPTFAVLDTDADGYIDVKGLRLTLTQAVYSTADVDIASAAFWAAEAGHRVAHTAVHVHGGVGIDEDHPIHRYFLSAKQTEFGLGGAIGQLLAIGRELADTPV